MIVLDTSFLVAALNERDVHHEAARDLLPQFADGRWGRAVLPEPAFGETVTVLAARRGIAYAARQGRTLQAAEELTVAAGSPLFGEAWNRFADQAAFELSFVDCVVLAAAAAGEADAVATFDVATREAAERPVLPEETRGRRAE